MPLEKLGGINIKMRILLVVLIINMILACSTVGIGGELDNWIEKTIDTSDLVKEDLNNVDKKLVADIQGDYRKNPKSLSYDELHLFAVYLNKTNGRKILFFDINYVDDIQVIYEVDHDGRILDKYLYSAWN